MIRAGQKLEDGVPFEEVQDLVPLIAYGLAVNEYQSRRRGEIPAGLLRETDPLGALLDARAVSDFDAAVFSAEFDSGVRALEDDSRDAYILTEIRGLTRREAADVLSTYPMSVQRRAEQARAQIREELAA